MNMQLEYQTLFCINSHSAWYVICIYPQDHNVHALIFTDAVAFHNGHFGTGISTSYLRSVGCRGTESKLINCPRITSGSCDSVQSENAGVRCQGMQECNKSLLVYILY